VAFVRLEVLNLNSLKSPHLGSNQRKSKDNEEDEEEQKR